MIKRIYAKALSTSERHGYEPPLLIYIVLENGFISRSKAKWKDLEASSLEPFADCFEGHNWLEGLPPIELLKENERKKIERSLMTLKRKSDKNGNNYRNTLNLPDLVMFNGIAIQWLNKSLVCSICSEICGTSKMQKTKHGSDIAEKHYPLDWFEIYKQGTVQFADDEDITRMDSVSSVMPYAFCICESCNPRNQDFNFTTKRRLEKKGDGSPFKKNPNVTLYEEFYTQMAKCWPSYKRFERVKEFNASRAIKKWAQRNPARVSTPAARNFFKMALGIADLESFITKSLQNQKEPTK